MKTMLYSQLKIMITSLSTITNSVRSQSTLCGHHLELKTLKMANRITKTGRVTKREATIIPLKTLVESSLKETMMNKISTKSNLSRKVIFYILPTWATTLLSMTSWTSWRSKSSSLREPNSFTTNLANPRELALFKWTPTVRPNGQSKFWEPKLLLEDRWWSIWLQIKSTDAFYIWNLWAS